MYALARSIPTLYDRPRHVLEKERHLAGNRVMVESFKGHGCAARLWSRILADLDAELLRTDRRAS